jgi:hypothetical protein
MANDKVNKVIKEFYGCLTGTAAENATREEIAK